jgi:hypothetical protein
MEAIAARPANAAETFMPPWALRAMRAWRGERLKRFLHAALEGMNAAAPGAASEFFRYPFP